MTAATLHDVCEWTERDSVFWHYVAIVRSAYRSARTWAVVPFVLPGAFILAQIFPSRMLKHLKALNSVLPEIQNDEELELIRDMLKLAYGAGCFLRHLSLRRGAMRDALSEIDETIDSLNLVLNNHDELKAFADASESRRTQSLPMFNRSVA